MRNVLAQVPTGSAQLVAAAIRTARMALRHVTATEVGAASVLKMVDELLAPLRITCLNQAV